MGVEDGLHQILQWFSLCVHRYIFNFILVEGNTHLLLDK